MTTKLVYIVLVALLVQLPVLVLAQEDDDDDIELFGVEAEELLALAGSVVAIALATLTFLAYRRSKKTKLLFVASAFGLFALRLFAEGSELFMDEIAFIDPVAILVDVAILLLFFYAVIKK